MAKKSVFLYGYWKHNLGDDLFAHVFLNRYPNVDAYMVTKKQYAKYYEAPNAKLIYSDSFLYKIKNQFSKKLFGEVYYAHKYPQITDLSIFLGGSLFPEHDTWEEYLRRRWNPIVHNAKVSLAVGCNLGPVYTDEFKTCISKFFGDLNGACLRDKKSVDLLQTNMKRLSINAEHIKYVPDVAFQLLYTDSIKKGCSPYPGSYVISVINPDNRIGLAGTRDQYEKNIIELAKRLSCLQNDKPIVIYTLCDDMGDGEFGDTVAAKLHDKGINAVCYHYEHLEEGLALLNEAKGVVATHFHTMLISYIFGIPVFPIIYSEKMRNVLEDFEHPLCKDVDICTLETLNIDDETFERINAELTRPFEIPSKIKDEAIHFFDDCDKYLEMLG